MIRLIAAQCLFTLPVVVVLGGAAWAGDTRSVQPYIDQIKSKWKSPPSGSGTEPDPFIQSIRKKLPPTAAQPTPDVNGGYIEQLRRANPSLRPGGREDGPSYSDQLKGSLEPADTRSAIAETVAGRSRLRAKREGRIKNAAGFKVGTVLTRTVTRSGSQYGFADIYKAKWVPDLTAFFEYQPFHSEWFGNVGIVASFGFAQHRGSGQFAFAPRNPFGSTFSTASSTKFTFMTLPVMIGANYRFNLLRVLRPYVQAGPAAIGYIEMRDDDRGGNRGYSTGYSTSLGANLKLDWFDRTTSWDLYQTGGVHQYYLTVEYSRLATISGPVDFSVSGVSAGLTYEF